MKMVNGNDTFRLGRYFYGGDSVDNSASHVFKKLAIEATDPADHDYLEASTGRVFVAQSPELFTYDADGNMLTDGRFRYTWNAENRMVMAEELYAPTNREPYVITYAYDHKGRMVRKEISRGGTKARRIEYIWDGWNIIRETTTDLSTLQLPTSGALTSTAHSRALAVSAVC